MKTVSSIAVVLAGVFILWTKLSFGQASESEMQGFPMPPPSGFVATKKFAYAGDFGYYTSPPSSLPGSTANASDYKYVLYSGLDGKLVTVYGAWGTTLIPAASAGGDACFHAHTSYGVWGRSEIAFAFSPNTILWTGWSFLGGGA